MDNNNTKATGVDLSRRDFIKQVGAASALAMVGCATDKSEGSVPDLSPSETMAQMEYRTCPTSGDKVSLLGYGCMRWPTDDDGNIDQETTNRLVDYAIAHGVNYFDTSPVYCKGMSEKATGIALSRHPRNSYFVATKLSNFAKHLWSREESMKMYENSFKELQVDYIDYLLLHAIGQGGMDALNGRYIDNGMLDFLVEERKKGRIRNLGFSYHGDIEVFDYLLSQHDKYKWDFVQIQLNYVDWKHSKEINKRNTDAEYLYAELDKRNIPAVIMEPLLGGRLARLQESMAAQLKQAEPERSVASWAFRYAGSFPKVLTVLSGMTYMEHLQDNLVSYAPFEPIKPDDFELLEEIAQKIVALKTIPCNDCKYCMPCPYAIDIPAVLLHYNKCINEGHIPDVKAAEGSESDRDVFERNRRIYLVSYDRSVPKQRQAEYCIGCGKCVGHCPQNIDIPRELHRIDSFVNQLKKTIDL